MTLLVLSDSHGRADRLAEALQRHPRAEALFLGDGLRDLDALPFEEASRIVCVRGNCDTLSALYGEIPTERLLRFGDHTVWMLHGHTHDVKSGVERAVRAAAARGVDLLLYGHTHTAKERYLPSGTRVGETVLERPMYLLNPGSLGAPHGARPSYGLADLTPQGILLSHGFL